jgi:hypothetical protein
MEDTKDGRSNRGGVRARASAPAETGSSLRPSVSPREGERERGERCRDRRNDETAAKEKNKPCMSFEISLFMKS